MISHLVFYQLALIAVMWVFLMLYGLWPSEPMATRLPTPEPLMPLRHRAKEPKPFPLNLSQFVAAQKHAQ